MVKQNHLMIRVDASSYKTVSMVTLSLYAAHGML